MARYNVGDKIVINDSKAVTDALFWTSAMDKFIGKALTVSRAYPESLEEELCENSEIIYDVEETTFSFSDEHIDHEATARLNKQIEPEELIDVFDMEHDKLYQDANSTDMFRLDYKGQLERSTDGGGTFKVSNLRYKTLRGLQVFEVEQEEQFPVECAKYYYISTTTGSVLHSTWDNTYADKCRASTIGIYHTEEEAQEVLDKIKEQFGMEFNS